MSTDRYESAKQIYADIGIDTEQAIKKLSDVRLSIHCWQGDDIDGFENDAVLSGGIQATGNCPGKARNPEELMGDIKEVLKLVPGKHKINLHAIYAINDVKTERDELKPTDFKAWVDFAKENELGLDINPTFFSHSMAESGLTLSSPDENVRQYWIRHAKAIRVIGEYFGKELGITCLNNIWIPDGYKDVPADRFGPRARLKASLDDIFSVKHNPEYLADSVESKLFGIGAEAYTVGSHEFYMNYAATKENVMCLLDNGHFHPTEVCSDKIPSLLLFKPTIAFHVTRGIRWDSDHVVAFDDELREIAKEIVRCNALSKAFIGLDYFDASINRVAAWVIGVRNMQKALLSALLTPFSDMKTLQDSGDFTKLFALSEQYKTLPIYDIWEEFCRRNNAPLDNEWYSKAFEYEKTVLLLRR